jgi:hypothetical protein
LLVRVTIGHIITSSDSILGRASALR